MQLITRQTQANTVAARYRNQYFNDITKGWINVPFSPEEQYNKLVALGPTPDPEDVIKITNKSWVIVPHCDECNEHKDAVIVVGDEYNTVHICGDCLIKALALIEET